METSNRVIHDKRSQPDTVLQVVEGMAMAIWAILALAIITIYMGRPEINLSQYGISGVARFWQPDLFWLLGILSLFAFGLANIGLHLNGRRLRRHGDSFRVPLVLLWGASLVGMLIFVFV